MSAPVDRTPLLPRILFVVGATVTMAVAVIAISRTTSRRSGTVRNDSVPLVQAGAPIPSEAGVFRRFGLPNIAGDSSRRDAAHPRTLATYRARRSYPGAPPRVPHGLTPAEFRTQRCNTCHERGGFSQRFGSYAPVTPHPELAGCLACHAANYELAGVALPRSAPNDACRQCHIGVPALFSEQGLDWRAAPWPLPARRGSEGVPAIPHELSMRGNCLACHLGPAAVAEIRTRHPERADCRQCHVAAGADAAPYVRATASAGSAGRSVP